MNDATGFTAFVPGFDFIKNLGRQASAASPNAAIPGMAWVAPTFDVEELDKRIKELQSVLFWLEQNARALSATIQALEVQKMTLSTLKNMDVGMDEVAKAMHVNPADLWSAWQTGGTKTHATAQSKSQPKSSHTADTADATEDTTEGTATGATGDKSKEAVDPTQWWASVSQQFQDIAASAMQDISKAAAQANAMAQATSKSAKPVAKKPATKKAAATKAAPAKRGPAKRPVAKKASARTAATKRRA
ncbi:hypothetical protein LN050_09520 [Comamonadaceae bacterium M7527]|nr:hypothetical protein LN050_09520 [Comamonadaceae bacterium M7527]